MSIKKIIKLCTPPIFLKLLQKIFTSSQNIYWKKYDSWTDAYLASTGYDTNEIFNKVYDANIKIRDGKAVYERDSVIFDKIQYDWPLTASLL